MWPYHPSHGHRLKFRPFQLEGIEHRTTRVRRPQSNGFVERPHRTLLDEHSRIAGRSKWYESLEEMERDLFEFLPRYNHERTHRGEIWREEPRTWPSWTECRLTETPPPRRSSRPSSNQPACEGRLSGEYYLCTIFLFRIRTLVIHVRDCPFISLTISRRFSKFSDISYERYFIGPFCSQQKCNAHPMLFSRIDQEYGCSHERLQDGAISGKSQVTIRC